jgi:MerR family transcriptional regulator, copper efflux regulator
MVRGASYPGENSRRTAVTFHTIGRVARQSGVGVETVRFYERKGLIPQPPRPDSGFRRYPQDAVSRIRFIQRSKALGFSLREIRDLLTLRVDSATSCGEVKKRAEAKIVDIEGKIRQLREMKHALVKLTTACRGKGPTAECPILEALGEPDRTPSSKTT